MNSLLGSRASLLRLLSHGKRSYSSDAPRDYNAAVTALNALQSNFSIVEEIRRRGPGWNKLAIPEMISWLRRIGYEPADLDVLNPIHIAGTKGKGSTSAFISSILTKYVQVPRPGVSRPAFPSVGLYTSPHLRFVRERIQINNQPISEERFAQCFWTIWDRLESTSAPAQLESARSIENKPVYFHYLTLMALHCYLEDRIGSAIIECGIGGEYDTTNVFVRPSVTGITSLGIDHESLLGDTIESIAWHKSGIFKPDCPAFTAPQGENALEVLHVRAKERGTRLHVVQPHAAVDNIQLGLRGDFQKVNASLAVAICAQHLQRLGYQNVPDPLDRSSQLPEEFVRGLENAHLGGRCDKRVDPLMGGLDWFIDGGHTLESIEMAGRWYGSEMSDQRAAPPARILIFNQQTRDADALARRLHSTLVTSLDDEKPFTHVIFCPNVTYRDAGYKADLVSINTNKDDVNSLRVQRALAESWVRVDPDSQVHVLPTIEEAITRVRSLANGRPTSVLCTGSLHLVGGLIEVLESEAEKTQVA